MLKKLIISVAFFVLSIVVQAQTVRIPEGAKFNLKNFDLDLTESVSTYFYLNRDGFKQVVYNSLRRRLQSAEVLSATNSPTDINLDIYVDYLRRFPGDQTPFPSSSLASPNFSIKIRISNEDHVFFQEESRELTIIGGTLFGTASNKDIDHDIKFIVGLTNTIMQKIATASPLTKISPLATNDEATETANEYLSLLEKMGIEKHKEYIPDAVADDYIKRLQSAEFKSRIVAYQDIGRDWINSKKLFDFIKNEISQRYTIEGDSDNTKEVREAMNALASSGLIEYHVFFKEIKASASDKKISNQVEDSEKILLRRAFQGAVVHNSSIVNAQESWKVNQLTRMLLLNDPKIREQAAKYIYANLMDNVYLLDTLAKTLENEAFKNSYSTSLNANVHKWICRILGDSKNKKYADLLNKAKNDAVFEDVRKYATKYLKVLNNS